MTFLADLWNSTCTSLPAIKTISGQREKHAQARITDLTHEPDFWKDVFAKVESSDFLSGRSTDWKASFDWVMNPNNLTKILEGNYQNFKKKGQAAGVQRGKTMTQKEMLGPFYNPEVHGDGDRVIIK